MAKAKTSITTENRSGLAADVAAKEQRTEMPLSDLHPFEGHPFKVLDDELMEQTVESIKQIGVVSPLIVRPDPEGGFEILSGHRRLHAAQLAGLETVPVIVKEMDDDAAIIFMVDSNLQRENILPSERAFSYKMKLDAMKHQGTRNDLETTSRQVVGKLEAADNVDHRKLLKQIWTLGIRDTKLIQIIKAMLKAPIEMPDGETVLPSKGTPQGGILSPLLANIVLNELDWWIASQWDEMVRHMKHPCKVTYYPNGVEKKCNSYTALKKSNLKEMRIVRYADDFKIFCRTKEDAEKTYYAVKDWLWKRLKLEVSDEKSKVTNLRKRDSEFLGFRIKLRRKSNSWVITSNVCDKAIHRIGKEMADSVKAIQSSKTAEEISLNVGDYNAKVIGVQDYYCIATRVNLNFSDIARPINGQLLHRIDGIKKQGEIKNRYLRKRYGKSKQMRWIGETPLVPLAYVQFKIPMRKSRKINPYTPEGRAEIHDNLRIDVNSMLWLMRHPIPTESVRYNDNRVSLYAGQDGKCAITGMKLDVQTCICYRKTNNCKKGNDSYQNLLLLSLQGLAIVSSEDMMSVVALVKEYSLNAKVITKVNKLRATAGLPLLAAK